MNDIAKMEHIVYLIRKYENECIEDSKVYQRQTQMLMMSSANKDTSFPKEPLTMEDKATEIIARIKATLENT